MEATSPRNAATTIPVIAGVPSFVFSVVEVAGKVEFEVALVVLIDVDDGAEVCPVCNPALDSTLLADEIVGVMGFGRGYTFVDC